RVLCREVFGDGYLDAAKEIRYRRFANAVRPKSLFAELFEVERSFDQCGRDAIREAELRLIRRTRVRLLDDLVARPVRLDRDTGDLSQHVVAAPASAGSNGQRAIKGGWGGRGAGL